MKVSSFVVCCFVVFSSFAVAADTVQAQSAKCDPLPKVEWWSQTHAKVIATVEKQYKGDWSKYIDLWKKYGTRMQKILDAKSVAVVKSRGIKMRGKDLQEHIKQVNRRIVVLECLRETYSKPLQGEDLDQVAAVSGASLDLQVIATCNNGAVNFQIINLGEKWPKLASINIYRTDTKVLISKRRMKLRNSQQITFKVSREKAQVAGELGLWVEPTWTKRPFKYDVKQICR